MDINRLYNVSAPEIVEIADRYTEPPEDYSFDTFLRSAVNQLNETDDLIQKQENEEIKLSLGLSDNTHDLAIAQQKAYTALQYTVALRDRFIEAYREIMQIQI